MNPFSVLESDDEEDKPITVVKKDKPVKKEKPAAPKPPTPAPVEVAPPITEKPNSGRGGAQRGRGGAGRGRGRGEKKGGKPLKHEGFERHSGTGRGKEISKGGSGKGNWGNPKEEAEQAEKEPIEEVIAADTPAVEEEVAPGQVTEEPAVPEVVEPEVKTYTLDEYLAQRGASRSNSEVFGKVAVRRVDASEFSNLKTVEESEDTFIALGSGKSSKKSDGPQRSAKTAKVKDIGFSVAPTETSKEGGRGRGRGRGRGEGRGEGRGRGGRGGGRRNNSENKVDINDSAAFPSL